MPYLALELQCFGLDCCDLGFQFFDQGGLYVASILQLSDLGVQLLDFGWLYGIQFALLACCFAEGRQLLELASQSVNLRLGILILLVQNFDLVAKLLDLLVQCLNTCYTLISVRQKSMNYRY